MALTANQFDQLILGVRMGISSLAGCAAQEVEREALHLRNAVTDLCEARLARSNTRLHDKRTEAVKYASEVLARRAA